MSGAGPPAPGTLTHEQIGVRLREVALFRGLGQEDLAEILRISEAVRIDEGHYVFEEGDEDENFYVIVHGSVELRKATGSGFKRLGTLHAGQAFGEMALLNDAPRSASAVATSEAYLLSVSRGAFGRLLGGDTLSVRLLRNLSKALWATSLRLAAQQTEALSEPSPSSGPERLPEFNRSLRARLLPRVTPRVRAYDLAATTLAPRDAAGCTAWDWFVLRDGRPAFTVSRAVGCDELAAQRLSAARLLLRTCGGDLQPSLGALLTRVSRGLRAGWVDGVSGPVSVAVVALSDGAAECAAAGDVTGVITRIGRAAEDLAAHAPPVGEDPERAYDSSSILLAPGDRILVITGSHHDATRGIATRLGEKGSGRSKEAMERVMAGLEDMGAGGRDGSDVSAVVITRTTVGLWGS